MWQHRVYPSARRLVFCLTFRASVNSTRQVDMEEPKMFTSEPSFTLGFEIVYITREFTQYQMAWHYGWIMVVLVFMFVPKIGFFYEMMQLHQNFWSRQQVRRATATFSLVFVKGRARQWSPASRTIEGDLPLFSAQTDAGGILPIFGDTLYNGAINWLRVSFNSGKYRSAPAEQVSIVAEPTSKLLTSRISSRKQYAISAVFHCTTAMQARVGVLLLSLLFFNNVFFVAQIYSPFPRFFFR